MMRHTLAIGLIIAVMPVVLAAANTSTVLAPVLDDQTFAVLRVKLTPAQLDAFTQEIAAGMQKHAGREVAAAIQGELKTFNAEAGQILQSLEQAGAPVVYAVFSLRTLPGFMVVAPTDQNPKALIPIMKQMARHFETKVIADTNGPDLVVAGPAPVVAKLADITPTRPQALAQAMASCQDTSALHLALAPSPDLRVIVQQMLPQLPLGPGSIPLGDLVDHLEWASLDLQAPPQMGIRVTTHSLNDAHASELRSDIQALYAVIGQMSQVRDEIPGIDALLSRLVPTQQRKRLSLKVDQATTETVVKEALASSLVGVRRKVTQHTCGTNVSGIGKAVLIYANDHEDNLPPTLEDLHKVELSEKGMRCPAVKTKDSYVYRGSGLHISHSLDLIVLYDKKENHHGTNHRNVLFLDTRVEWVPEERFQELIRQDNAYRRKKGLPELPAE